MIALLPSYSNPAVTTVMMSVVLLLVLISLMAHRYRLQAREMAHRERIKSLEVGRSLPDADIARYAAVTLIAFLVPLVALVSAFITTVSLPRADGAPPSTPLVITIWSLACVVTLGTLGLTIPKLFGDRSERDETEAGNDRPR